jgi:tricorn protease
MLAMLFASSIAMGQVEEMRLMRWPDVHENKVVFTYAGDLWISTLEGGIARRLTSHPNNESNAQFSPDGKWIAFTGSYDGNAEIYVVSSDGGEPKRLTYTPEGDGVIGWLPDGSIAYKSAYGSFNGTMAVLWKVSATGGPSVRMPVWEISDGSFSPDGKSLAYNRAGSHQFNWRRYRGGTQGFISI